MTACPYVEAISGFFFESWLKRFLKDVHDLTYSYGMQDFVYKFHYY